ncbi:MAG: hypothetical protein ACLQPH_06465 [Acidimicrobiales bacterium]
MTTTDPVVVERAATAPPDPSRTRTAPEAAGDSVRTTPHRGRTLLLAAAGYLLVSLFVWWNVWSGHPTSSTTCGCGDSALFLWFLEWPAHALAHGLNPFYSNAMSYPGGVNLLDNTSELAVGVVLAPVTWAFGPVATLNVAVTLAPVLSALSMFALLRRWVSWAPAAFVGGLLYGFSPFVMVSLTDAHLMIGMAPVPPLVVLCLDELLVRQRRRPVVTGVALGLLVVVQFFVGTELLVIMGMCAALGVMATLVYSAFRPEVLPRRAPYALRGLGAAAVTVGLLLAYPVWFVLAGPAHTSGPVWPDLYLGYEGTLLKPYVFPAGVSASFTRFALRVGGYQGPTLSGQYVGWGVVAVVVGGTAVWRRDRRLWLFGALAAVSVVLSLGARPHYWLPWSAVAGLPQFQNIIPSRFLAVIYLALGVMVGLVVDHAYAAVRGGRQEAPSRPHARRPTSTAGRGRRWLAAAAATAVAAVAVVPVAAYLAESTPATVQPVVLPTWFRTVAPRLEGHQVLLVYPLPNQVIESAMAWQAVDGMDFTMVGGGGPGAVLQRAGKERAGLAVIGTSSFSFSRQTFAAGDEITVRDALDGWGVTMVVIPDEPGLATYDRVTSVPYAVALMTAATGQAPVRQQGAWVWTGLTHAGAPVHPTVEAFSQCVAAATPPIGAPEPPPAAAEAATAAVATCVLSAPSTGP